MSHVYLNEDPELCVCRGKGEYWAVGKSPVIFNVFSVYPDFPDLDQMLVPCQYHRAASLSFEDYEMLDAAGIVTPKG